MKLSQMATDRIIKVYADICGLVVMLSGEDEREAAQAALQDALALETIGEGNLEESDFWRPKLAELLERAAEILDRATEQDRFRQVHLKILIGAIFHRDGAGSNVDDMLKEASREWSNILAYARGDLPADTLLTPAMARTIYATTCFRASEICGVSP